MHFPGKRTQSLDQISPQQRLGGPVTGYSLAELLGHPKTQLVLGKEAGNCAQGPLRRDTVFAWGSTYADTWLVLTFGPFGS